MRASLLILALALPASAAAVIFDQPDFARIFSRVVSASEEGTTCTFRPGFTSCSDGRTITTTREGGATCLDGSTVGANEACITEDGLESFAAGFGGRTAGDVHTISTEGWPTTEGELRWQATLQESTAGVYFYDSRPGGGGVGLAAFIDATGRFGVATWGVLTYSAVLPWVAERRYSFRVTFDDTTVTGYRDGVLVFSGGVGDDKNQAGTARIGERGNNTGTLNGSIHSLSWISR